MPGITVDKDCDESGFHMFLGAEAMQQLSIGVDPVYKWLINIPEDSEDTGTADAKVTKELVKATAPVIAAYALPVNNIKTVVEEYKKTHKPLTMETFFND